MPTEKKPPTKATRIEKFSESATAAEMSGKFNSVSGYLKRKLGKLTDDPALEQAGQKQELVGKIHGLVGSLRRFATNIKKVLLK